MPMIGIGTYGMEKSTFETILREAISLGANYIDSAYRYDNEAYIGSCFERGIVKREDVLLGTKISYNQQMSISVNEAVEASLNNLKTDYIDLYFIHSVKSKTYCEDFEDILRIRDDGKIREIAVSNFDSCHIEELFKKTGVYPVLNQIEIHIGCYQKELIDYCLERNIAVQASCPLMRMKNELTNNAVIQELQLKYQVSFAQLSLRWLLQHDIVAIPRTQNLSHLIENLNIFDFQINDSDMRQLDNIKLNNNGI